VAELTIEQKRAMAMAQARMRMGQKPAASAPAAPRFDSVPTQFGGDGSPQYEPNKASGIDRFMANPLVRFATGAADLPLGMGQAVANVGKIATDAGVAPTGLSPSGLLAPLAGAFNERLQSAEESKRRGMAASGDETDVAGFMGSLAAGGAAAKGLPIARSTMGRIGQGAATGAAFGAAAPIKDGGEDFGSDKAAQVGIGATIGAAIPGGLEVGRRAIGGVAHLTDRILPGGARRIADREIASKIANPTDAKAIVGALRNYQPPVAGYPANASQALKDLPEGYPLIGIERQVANVQMPVKGKQAPVTLFSQRERDQAAAIDAARLARKAATDPMRQSALQSTQPLGAKETVTLLQQIQKIKSTPGYYSNDTVRKSMDVAFDRITNSYEKFGKLLPDELYTIRKQIAKDIKTTDFAPGAKPDKKLVGALTRQVQDEFDNAIEKNGGAGWRAYLKEFADRSKNIDDAEQSAKVAGALRRKLAPQAGDTLDDQAGGTLPGMLDRTMMLVNAMIRRGGKEVKPKIAQELAIDFLDPKKLADAVERGQISPKQAALYQSLLKQMQYAAPIAATEEN
jgi:hypothetical protein